MRSECKLIKIECYIKVAKSTEWRQTGAMHYCIQSSCDACFQWSLVDRIVLTRVALWHSTLDRWRLIELINYLALVVIFICIYNWFNEPILLLCDELLTTKWLPVLNDFPTLQTLLTAIEEVSSTHQPLKRNDDSQFKAFVCTALKSVLQLADQWD